MNGMKRQFLQIKNIRANKTEIEAFSFLALHLGIFSDSRTQVRYASKSARASGIFRTF